jgi:CPA2 family monovalent cation:H+ antiporter-2
VLRIVTASRRREAFPLAILVASVGTAWAASIAGLSMAIGAFLAGLMLAESEFSHQAYAEIRGVRDILGALFFISLGMLLDVSTALQNLPAIIGIGGLIILVKAVAATAALLASAAPLRIAITGAIGLSQVGEFSFILGRAGLEAGLIPPTMWQILLGASILTMVATPSLIAAAPPIAIRLTRMVRPAARDAAGGSRGSIDSPDRGVSQDTSFDSPDPALAQGTLRDHVIVFGFGVGGQLVARALRELRIEYLILELNGATVRQARAAGEPIVYGDATSPESLHGAHVEHAAAVVSVMSDVDAAARMVRAVRSVSSTVPVIVRTRFRLEADRLQKLGATVAVAEELEASLEVLAQLLARLHVAGNVIEPLLEVFRRESVGGFRPVRAPRPGFDAMPDAISRMPVATHLVQDEEWAAGRSLSEINLRAVTGASVLAIQRNGKYTTSPPADTIIEAADLLYLVGDDSDIALARHHIASGE